MVFIIGAALAVLSLASSLGFAAGEPQPVSENTRTMDSDGDGYIDRVRVTFSTTMDTSTQPQISTGAGDPGIRIDGYTIDQAQGQHGPGFTWSGSMSLDIFLVEGSEPDTDARPSIIYVAGGGLVSSASSEVPEGSYATKDGAGPVLMSVRGLDKAPAALFNATGDELMLVFSEPAKLAGVTPTERALNLERALRFEPADGASTCPDGDGSLRTDGTTSRNLPQPKADTAALDPILEPKDAQTSSEVFRVQHRGPSNFNSTHPFNALPQTCRVLVDAGVQRSVITDLASTPNVAVSSLKHFIQPFEASLVIGLTRDGTDGAPDGILDAVELTFDHKLDAQTIDQPITIASGGQQAQIIGREVFGVAENQLRLRFTPISGWTTGVRPTISYAKPSSCSLTGGTGMKAVLALGGSWRTCVGTIDSYQLLDVAPPVASSAKTLDADLDGLIDGVEVTFTERIAGHLAPTAWRVNNAAVSAVSTLPDPNQHKVKITFSESVAETTPHPVVSYTRVRSGDGFFQNPAGSHDSGNNEARSFSMAAVDGVQPRIVTAEQFDADGNGDIDRVVLTYSEPVEDPSNLTGLSVGGRPVTLIAPGGDDSADDAILTLRVDGLTGTQPRSIEAAAAVIKDAAGNPSLEETLEAAPAMDKASPVATLTVLPSAPIPVGEARIRLVYSEPMDTATEPTITFTTEQGTKPVTSQGWSEDALTWEGTLTIVEGDCSVSTGCPVTVEAADAADLAANAQRTVTLDTKIDTVAPAAPVLGTLTVAPAGAAPADYLNMFVRDLTITASVNADEATGGVARLLLDGEPVSGAADDQIGASDQAVSVSTGYGSADALQAAIAEGAHSFSIELCDVAGNCSISASTADVTADYTPVSLTLTAPTGGETVQHGSTLSISWDGDETALDLDHIEVARTLDGSSWSLLSDSIVTPDGSYEWTTPEFVHTTDARVRAAAVDAAGNKVWDTSGSFTIEVPQTFSDVSRTWWPFASIERIAAAGITSGCGGDRYCPMSSVTRGQMAVFLLRSVGVTQDDLQPYRGLFSDVPESSQFALWIERLSDEGITSGCGGGRYCPNSPITRGQMSVFLLKAKGIVAEDLQPYRGLFTDVPASSQFALWIERMSDEGITSGCGGGRYCPGREVTRAQMAVFLVNAFDL